MIALLQTSQKAFHESEG